ncbi:hypothetical protein ACFLXO_05970 [Chloroflexota bacterium]
MDEKAEINRLPDEGYSVKQIIDLGFKRRTVYHYAKLRVKPENEPSGSDTAVGSNGRVKHEMIKLGSKDVIPPITNAEYHSCNTLMISRNCWLSGLLCSPRERVLALEGSSK